MRKLLVLIAATSLLAVVVTTAFAATRTVKVGDNWFVRSSGVPTVTVSKDTTVIWRFVGRSSHNVHSIKGPSRFTLPRSGTKISGSVRRKMTRRGTYTIICDVHGRADQSMKLVVK